MKQILQAPHPILASVAKPCVLKDAPDTKLTKLITDMKKTLNATKDPEGVGLAAPQVRESLRLFVVKPTPKSTIEVFINPQILTIKTGPSKASKKSRSKEKQLEGCLSLTNIWGQVKRDPVIGISYVDKKGTPHEKTFRGFLATIIQHEMDHLDGILFPKRVLEQKGKLYKSHKDKKGKDVFEEIAI